MLHNRLTTTTQESASGTFNFDANGDRPGYSFTLSSSPSLSLLSFSLIRDTYFNVSAPSLYSILSSQRV